MKQPFRTVPCTQPIIVESWAEAFDALDRLDTGGHDWVEQPDEMFGFEDKNVLLHGRVVTRQTTVRVLACEACGTNALDVDESYIGPNGEYICVVEHDQCECCLWEHGGPCTCGGCMDDFGNP